MEFYHSASTSATTTMTATTSTTTTTTTTIPGDSEQNVVENDALTRSFLDNMPSLARPRPRSRSRSRSRSSDEPPVLPPLHGLSDTLTFDPFIPRSLHPFHHPPASRRPAPAPLRIARRKGGLMEVMPALVVPDTAPSAPSAPVVSPPLSLTIQTPASLSAREISLYLPTPPLSDATSSPPSSSDRPSSLVGRPSLSRPESVQFGPRVARNSRSLSSSISLEQQRGVAVASPDEFGVRSLSTATQSITENPQPPVALPPSPAPSFPNPYTNTLRRTQTTSSIDSNNLSSSSAEFGPRPRPKPALTLNLLGSTTTTTIAINDADALLPNPYQQQQRPHANPNLHSYFSPHTPADPLLNTNPPIQTGIASSLGADLHTAFGVSYFSPHTPATSILLPSSLGPVITTAISTAPLGATTRERQTNESSAARASGLLAPPLLPSAAFGSYWSPHTPDVPEHLANTIGAAAVVLVEEPEDDLALAATIPTEEPEDRNAADAAKSPLTTAATHGHSAEPPSALSPPSPRHSPAASDEPLADTDATSNSNSNSSDDDDDSPGTRHSSKPQLKLQTWDLDRMREEKRRLEAASRRQGSRDKDTRNRERRARDTQREQEREREWEREKERPARVVEGAPNPRPAVPSGGGGREQQPPAALRPGGALFQHQQHQHQQQQQIRKLPVLDMLAEPVTTDNRPAPPPTQQNRRSIASALAWGLLHNAPPPNNAPPNTKANTDRAHARSPSEPSFMLGLHAGTGTGTGTGVSVGVGGAQGAELGGRAVERRRFGFFANAGGAASDTNLATAASTSSSSTGPKHAHDNGTREGRDAKEGRKGAFYSRGINASLEALVGWGGKVFSQPSTATTATATVNAHAQGEGSYYGTAPPPAAAAAAAVAHPYPYAHPYSKQLPTPPPTDTSPRPPLYPPPLNNARVFPAPVYPPGEREPSFAAYGVEIGRVGRNKTHTPPHSAAAAEVKKGHTKNNSSGSGGGFKRIFGFGKKEKEKPTWT